MRKWLAKQVDEDVEGAGTGLRSIPDRGVLHV